MGGFTNKQSRSARRASAGPNGTRATDSSPPDLVQQVLGLQQLVGNRAVQRLLGQDPDQAGTAGAVPAIAQEVLGAPGQPLDPATRALMDRRFGHDFSRVRVHTDVRAAESARSVLARAYTVGADVVFGEGEYAPGTHQGQELLAHELAHTVQQADAGTAPLSVASDVAAEQSAVSAGHDVAGGRGVSNGLASSAGGVARAPVPIDAYPPDMLAKTLAEAQERLKNPSYAGRDRDVELYRAVKREVDKRADASARAEAEAYLKSTEPPAPEERSDIPSKFTPGGFTNEDIDPGQKQREQAERKRTERAALDRRQEEEGRPARLAQARRFLIQHGMSRYDAADTLTHFLTVNDLRALQKTGLEPPGFWTRHYADKVIDAIDKIVPRDPIEDREDRETLQRGAAAIENTAQRIEGLASEGPHALGGRVVGATTAYIVGKDPLWGSEVGAAFGGIKGARSEARAWAMLPRSTNEPAPPEIDKPPVEEAPAAGALKPSLTFPRGTDVTGRGSFPDAPPVGEAKRPPRVVPPMGEALEEYRQRGGVIRKIPEGQSGTSPKTPMRLAEDPVTARPTGPPTPFDADVTSQPGMRRQFKAYPGKPQHHVFPQELRSWFAERFKGTSEDIHDYTVYLSEGEHQAIHKAGKGGVVKGAQEPDLKGWNQEWKDFKRDNPNASSQMIFEEAGQLMGKYGISGEEIARYRGNKKK